MPEPRFAWSGLLWAAPSPASGMASSGFLESPTETGLNCERDRGPIGGPIPARTQASAADGAQKNLGYLGQYDSKCPSNVASAPRTGIARPPRTRVKGMFPKRWVQSWVQQMKATICFAN
ncbi:hypothetical protein-signal peptide prediction [Rhodopirellula baltica SH 1]|uniref:Uncharacterized protein n=1 Tax=Rhodopirellula baltica (strain DSM 10527 / NCIMB 13988 / SH1) TaxID=243090 RepID=Q7UL37_RHOBA|nr:hypothetical protein-signal peptide prediction [Rhodopirellula baltica SH 1]